MIWLRGVTGAETVVNVHHGHAAGATVQHGEQRGDAAKARAVADARRHGDDRFGDESGDDARQRAFHAGDGDDDVRLLKRFHPREHPVQAGHADVVDALHAVAHDFGGDGGFLGHRQIARAGADDGDETGALGQRFFLDGHAAGEADDGRRA